MNPLLNLVEGEFGHGAVVHEFNPVTDYTYPNLGMAVMPFDWNIGYDIEEQSGFKLPVDNQNGSFSCGGQATSKYLSVLEYFKKRQYTRRSARDIYSHCCVPLGGSGLYELGNFATQRGIQPESTCPSYDNGNPPSEDFMRTYGNPVDISLLEKADVYAQLTDLSIDNVARSIRDNYGVVIGLHGENNGTWLSAFPMAIKQTNTNMWAHWVYAGKVKMIEGKKYIGILNSWGDKISENGWQWISEDFFNGLGIWSAWTMTDKSKINIPPFKYTFTQPITYGSKSKDVIALQKCLAQNGVYNYAITGNYFDITAQAVFDFQMKYNVDSVDTLKTLQGKSVGPKTIAMLNSLYSK